MAKVKGKSFSRKGPQMASSSPSRKRSAEDTLLDSFGELIDSAAEKMTDEEFKNAEKKSRRKIAAA